MTVKEFYEYVLIECNKVGTATIYLEDFNFFLNKAIQEFVNKRYSVMEESMQVTDDIQILVKSLKHIPTSTNNFLDINTIPNLNYLHLLSCFVTLEVIKQYKGNKVGDIIRSAAKRLTADKEAGIVGNAFLKPRFNRTYYSLRGDVAKVYWGTLSEFFKLKEVDVVYLRRPVVVELTAVQRDADIDISTKIEFPDYVCNEILKMVTMYLLENNSDPRMQTFAPINTDSVQYALQGSKINAAETAGSANRSNR